MTTELLYFDNNLGLIGTTNINTTATTSSYYDLTFLSAFTCESVAIWNAANFINQDSADITIEVTGSPSGSAVVKSDTFSASDLVGENSNVLVWDSIGMTGTHTSYRVKITTTDSFIHFDWKCLLGVYKSFSCDIKAPHRQRKNNNPFYINPINSTTLEFSGLSASDRNELINQLYARTTSTALYDYGLIIKQPSNDLFANDYFYGTIKTIDILENQRQTFQLTLGLESR